MISFVLGFLLIPGLVLAGWMRPQATPVPAVSLLSGRDIGIGYSAAALAMRHPSAAIDWVVRQRGVGSAQLGPDGATVDVRFRDGSRLAILPSNLPHPVNEIPVADRSPVAAPTGRAVVLEPFATELGQPATAGQIEAGLLSQAGFRVDVVRDGAVTVGVMKSLSTYSVVYMETHSGVLPGGDAVVVTGETDTKPYSSLFNEGSLMQALVAGHDKKLYDAITGVFVTRHMQPFPDSAIVYLDGCSVLAAPAFWKALQSRNVSVMLSWDREVYNDVSEVAADALLKRLDGGQTVADSLAATQQAGLGTSSVAGAVTHLGFLGDGSDTLSRALASSPSAVSATSTAIASTTPMSTARPGLNCKRRLRQR